MVPVPVADDDGLMPWTATSSRRKVEWPVEDQEFVGTVDRSPSLSWLAPTRAGALHGIKTITEEALEDLEDVRLAEKRIEADRQDDAEIYTPSEAMEPDSDLMT